MIRPEPPLCILFVMKPSLIRVLIGFCIGVALVTAATLAQPRFVSGSIPDCICELVLMPGKLLAVPFHDRGNASPEFLWRSRVFGSLVLSLVAFLALSLKRSRRSVISE